MTAPRPNPDVISQELDGEMVLVHLQTNQIYALNETGARFWRLLEDGHDIAGIHAALRQEYDVDPGELERELEAIVAELATQGLVVSADG